MARNWKTEADYFKDMRSDAKEAIEEAKSDSDWEEGEDLDQEMLEEFIDSAVDGNTMHTVDTFLILRYSNYDEVTAIEDVFGEDLCEAGVGKKGVLNAVQQQQIAYWANRATIQSMVEHELEEQDLTVRNGARRNPASSRRGRGGSEGGSRRNPASSRRGRGSSEGGTRRTQSNPLKNKLMR